MSLPPGGGTERVRIWDWPTRFVHWMLVVLIPLSWWSAKNDEMEWHFRSGLTVLGLLVFRLIWGFIGSSTARFSSFVRGPRAIFDYLRGRTEYRLGHNPIGALSVVALLGLLAVQVGLGLFASDEDGLVSGPLAHLISADLSEEITDLHEDNFDILLVLIGLHVAAIFFYFFVKRDNLVKPMVVGTREAPAGVEPMRPAAWWRFLVAAAIAFGVVSGIWRASGGY
jgi:cytochrome b